MITAEYCIGFIERGLDVRVGSTATHRTVRFTDRSGRIDNEFKVPLPQYETIMIALIDALAVRDGKSLRVDIKIDFYGAVTAECRTGLLRCKLSRLAISPRHITMLSNKIAELARVSEAA